ncbi:hypothetical protein ZHAS_00003428 [Anopheles sinensis]|uniref:Uncharacterized protein n=1 Tax=Anopheles sinensis TaxID=74873 RepID=A0A084VEA3_ANOSI|nr:hypothetical protein ZHAS_00003428 [Anopheles sinensis]
MRFGAAQTSSGQLQVRQGVGGSANLLANSLGSDAAMSESIDSLHHSSHSPNSAFSTALDYIMTPLWMFAS